jgi:hypothetical protein
VCERIIPLAKECEWYGYQTVTDLLRREGGGNDLRREGLNVPRKQPKCTRETGYIEPFNGKSGRSV